MGERVSFPKTFWVANTIELLERAAYYAVASFVVIYFHEVLGMAPTKSTFLNGTILWGLLYFLPPLSGTIADRFGFKKSLSLTFLLLFLGYLIVGTVQRFWPKFVGYEKPDYTIPVLIGILLIGIGGSFVKPCISGTVQKTSGANSALGFGIFYMTINIGSMLGRTVSYFVRTNFGIPSIFSYVATTFSFSGLLAIIFAYSEPKYVGEKTERVDKPRTLGDAILGLFTVLKNLKFVFFLIVIGFFWIIYVQIYNLIPLFLRFIDRNAPVELYTIVNPVSIVLFQLLVTRISKNWTPLKSIMVGITITIFGMLINIFPYLSRLDVFKIVSVAGLKLPIGGIFILISIACMAFGEMFASPRIYQYIGAIAPKGKEGLYLGYANLPIAIGTIIGAPLGGFLFEKFISNRTTAEIFSAAPVMWGIVAFMGVISISGVYLYNRFITERRK